MAITKALTQLQASATNAAAATATSTTLDMTTKYGGFVTAIVTNGATGPTLPCTFVIMTSDDNFTTSRDAYTFVAGTTASTTYTFNQDIPWGVMYLRSKFTGNTAQSVTVMAEIGAVTAI